MPGSVDKSTLISVLEIIKPNYIDKSHVSVVLSFTPLRLYLGSLQITKILYVGSKPVDSVYLGSTQVY